MIILGIKNPGDSSFMQQSSFQVPSLVFISFQTGYESEPHAKLKDFPTNLR